MRMKWPSVTEVALRLNEIRRKLLRTYYTDEIDKWFTVRIQIHESTGWWRLHIGDAKHNDDHSSYWGTDDISLKCNCLEVAASLLREAKEYAYVHGVD